MAKPIVHSIEPSRGPPGTLVTISGENFGSSKEEILGVSICRMDCIITLKWISSAKLSVITRKGCKNKGDVKILTKFGESEENIVFSGFMPTVKPTTEIGCWVEENINLIDEEKIEEVENFDFMGIQKSEEEQAIDSVKLFGNKSYDISRADFSPEYFLIKFYHNQSRKNFIESLNNIKLSQISSDEHNYQNFLEMNIIPIFRSLEMFNSMHSAILVDNTSYNMKIKLNELIQIANSESSLMFDDKIRKKERIDQVRNASTVFQTYKSLFLLPSNLNKLFNNYSFRDAATLYTSTVKSFPDVKQFNLAKSFLEQAKATIEYNTSNLWFELMTFPRPFQEHKQIIQFISTIKKDQSIFFKWVDGFLNYLDSHMIGLYKEYTAIESSTEPDGYEKVHEYAIFREFLFKGQLHKSVKVKYNSELLKFNMPPGIKLIKICISFINDNFLNFWRMCMINFNNLNTSQTDNDVTNKKFIEYGNKIFSRLITIITTVIQPNGKRSVTFFEEVNCRWTEKYSSAIQFWLPLILMDFDDMMISFHDVDPIMLKEIEEFYISLKALVTLKLVKLASQMIKNFGNSFDIGLLVRSNDATYSSIADIYKIVLINLADMLKFCFSKTTLNHNIFYSEWKDKLHESFAYLFYSIDIPISNLFESDMHNTEEIRFILVNTNQVMDSNYIINCSVALTSLMQIQKYLLGGIKDVYIQSGFEDTEVFHFVEKKFKNSYTRCQELLLSYCTRKLYNLTINIFDNNPNEPSNSASTIKIKSDERHLRQNFLPLILFLVKIKYIINSLNSELFNVMISIIAANHAETLTNNPDLLKMAFMSKEKISFFAAFAEFFKYFDAFVYNNQELQFKFAGMQRFIPSIYKMEKFDAELKDKYLNEILAYPLFSCFFS
ncbi:MAG: Exocyst complex component 2 [Marteilia pararefringens]